MNFNLTLKFLYLNFKLFSQNKAEKEAFKLEISEVKLQIQYMIEENRELTHQLESAQMKKNIAIIIAVLLTVLFVVLAVSVGSAFFQKKRMIDKLQAFDNL